MEASSGFDENASLAGLSFDAVFRHLRALLCLSRVAAVVAAIVLLLIGVRASRFISPAARVRFKRRWQTRGVLRLLRIMGGDIEVVGAPPAGPCLFVSNHLSYVDTLLLTAFLDPVCVAKREIAGWPMIGGLCRLFDTIFIDRNRRRDLPRVIAEVTAALRSGRTVLFFPEGTSTPGETVHDFKSPLFEAAVRTGVDVRYASLTYSVASGEPAPELSVCWWGDMPFASHFYGLLKLPGFRARLVFGAEPLMPYDRKALATAAWHRVMDDFTPVGYHGSGELEVFSAPAVTPSLSSVGDY
jgi:1-acyl-sn-glycerol-3-phosphate acyltransferase